MEWFDTSDWIEKQCKSNNCIISVFSYCSIPSLGLDWSKSRLKKLEKVLDWSLQVFESRTQNIDFSWIPDNLTNQFIYSILLNPFQKIRFHFSRKNPKVKAVHQDPNFTTFFCDLFWTLISWNKSYKRQESGTANVYFRLDSPRRRRYFDQILKQTNVKAKPLIL